TAAHNRSRKAPQRRIGPRKSGQPDVQHLMICVDNHATTAVHPWFLADSRPGAPLHDQGPKVDDPVRVPDATGSGAVEPAPPAPVTVNRRTRRGPLLPLIA